MQFGLFGSPVKAAPLAHRIALATSLGPPEDQ